jgi:hypothetical protein
MHRLLLPPGRQVMTSTLRLPPVQDVGGAVAGNLLATLTDRDALRRIKTTYGQRKLTGGVASPQQFTSPALPNDPREMATGAVKMNSRRLVNKTRGTTAGM